MNSGLYTAYTGLRAQSEALEVLANNLSNTNTTGYKEDKTFFTLLDQSLNDPGQPNTLTKAVNRSVMVHQSVNTGESSLSFTNRNLDVAIEGPGFLVVQAPQGIRYTRNGNLHTNARGVLTTSEGFPILGESGKPITVGPGTVEINQDADVLLNNSKVDSLKLVTFDKISALEKQGNSLFAVRPGLATESASDATIKSGYLEASNVNPITTMAQMVDIMRHFEAIQKSISLLMNDINSKAIEKLGK